MSDTKHTRPTAPASGWQGFPSDGTCPVDPDTMILVRKAGDSGDGQKWRAGNLASHAADPNVWPPSFRYEYQIAASPDAPDLTGEAVRVMEPFSDMAGEMFARGWDASNVALALDNPQDPHRVTAGDFFALRDFIAKAKEQGHG